MTPISWILLAIITHTIAYVWGLHGGLEEGRKEGYRQGADDMRKILEP